jgi:hypothetical protein
MHPQVGVAGELGGLLELVDGQVVHLLQRDVELDLCQGVTAVLADREGAVLRGEGVRGDLDVLDLLHLLDHHADLFGVRLHPLTLGGDEQDLPRGPGELGKALLESVEPLLGLGARNGQVVLELTTEPGCQTPQGDQHHGPECDDQPGATHDGVSEPVEQGGHVDTLSY